jgi:hypothetical protein
MKKRSVANMVGNLVLEERQSNKGDERIMNECGMKRA